MDLQTAEGESQHHIRGTGFVGSGLYGMCGTELEAVGASVSKIEVGQVPVRKTHVDLD